MLWELSENGFSLLACLYLSQEVSWHKESRKWQLVMLCCEMEIDEHGFIFSETL
jgi:hypothetical protein